MTPPAPRDDDETRELAALAAVVGALADGRPAPAGGPGELGESLRARLRAHYLAPLAHAHGVPGLRGDHAASAIRADQQRAIAEEAVAALGRAGIPVALHKGISYAGWLYPDAAQRPMSDVDLLVPPGRADAAAAALRRLGYWHAGPGIQRSARHHALGLKRRGASIDLHRGPVQAGRVAVDVAAVWRRAAPAPWIPGALRLEPVDEALFHFLNLARHDLIAPLLAYVDAARLLRAVGAAGEGAAAGELAARARAWRFERVHGACVELVEHVVGWRLAAPRWWLPRRDDLLRGGRPPRPVQLGRKLLLVEGPRELAGYAAAVLDGWRASLTGRP